MYTKLRILVKDSESQMLHMFDDEMDDDKMPAGDEAEASSPKEESDESE